MPLTFQELQAQRFTGKAWTIVYEYEFNDMYWGCDGSYDNEPDYWFLDYQEALDFAKQKYPENVLIDMLHHVPHSDKANAIVLLVECWEWINGLDDIRDDDNLAFLRYEKDSNDNVTLAERQIL